MFDIHGFINVNDALLKKIIIESIGENISFLEDSLQWVYLSEEKMDYKNEIVDEIIEIKKSINQILERAIVHTLLIIFKEIDESNDSQIKVKKDSLYTHFINFHDVKIKDLIEHVLKKASHSVFVELISFFELNDLNNFKINQLKKDELLEYTNQLKTKLLEEKITNNNKRKIKFFMEYFDDGSPKQKQMNKLIDFFNKREFTHLLASATNLYKSLYKKHDSAIKKEDLIEILHTHFNLMIDRNKLSRVCKKHGIDLDRLLES